MKLDVVGQLVEGPVRIEADLRSIPMSGTFLSGRFADTFISTAAPPDSRKAFVS